MEVSSADTVQTQTHEPVENGHMGDVKDGEPAVDKDSMEFRILLAYAKRRRPSDKRLQRQSSGTTPTPSPAVTGDDQQKSATLPKKKRKLPKFSKFFSCIRPQTKDDQVSDDGRQTNDDQVSDDGRQPAMLTDEPEADTSAGEVADKLVQISDKVAFLPGDIEDDNGNEDVVQQLVKLLRDKGDELDKEVRKNKALQDQLQRAFSYGLFSRVISAFLERLNLADVPEGQQKAKIAMTCEVVSRLSTLDTHPTSKTMGFGARYLHDYISPWVTRHGGWDKAFNPDDDEEVQ